MPLPWFVHVPVTMAVLRLQLVINISDVASERSKVARLKLVLGPRTTLTVTDDVRFCTISVPCGENPVMTPMAGTVGVTVGVFVGVRVGVGVSVGVFVGVEVGVEVDVAVMLGVRV